MACGFAFYFWQSARLKRLSVEPQKLAVLRLDNQTGDAALDPAGISLAMLLAERLSGLDRVSSFVVGSPGEAAARGANLLLHGRIERIKDRFQIVASLEQLSSREFEAAGAASGQRTELVSMLAVIAGGVQSAVRPKGQLAPAEFRNLETAIALGEAIESGSPDTALARLDAAVRAEPDCGLCWRRLVELNAAAGRKQAALDRAAESRARRLSPMSRAAIDYEAARLGEDVPGQRTALEKLAKLRAGEPEYLARLAALLAALGQWNESAETYRSAVQAAPQQGNIWNEFGYSLAWAGKTDEALRALNEYARHEPGSPNPPDSQGEVALMAGRFPQAIEFFEQSYKMDKHFNNGQALEKAALASYLNGEKARAASYVDRFLSALPQPGVPAARMIGARWQSGLGAISAAIKSAEAVEPAAAAFIAAAAGDRDEALRRLSAASQQSAGAARFVLASEPSIPPSIAERADLAPLRGFRAVLDRRWAAAAAEFQSALKGASAISPQATLLRESAAWALVMDSKPSEAAKLLRASWPLATPGFLSDLSLLVYPNLFYTRAEIALAAGRRDEARKFYDLFLLYAGERKDAYGMMARARAAARL